MRRSFFPFCLIMAAVFVVTASYPPHVGLAQTPHSPNSSQEQSLTNFLRGFLGDGPSGIDPTTRYVASFVDLNDDGMQDVIVYVSGRNWCGSGGCNMYVLAPKGASYELMAKTTITRLPIRVLASKSHGWHDISVMVQGGGVIQAFEARLSFDGRKYPSNPSVPPARRLTEPAVGTVVIPLSAKGKLLF